MDRRTLLTAAAMAPVAASARAAKPLLPGPTAGDWDAIASQYDLTRDTTQLEHGNWGMMARPVLAAYKAHLDRVNRENSYYARRTLASDMGPIIARLAHMLGVAADDIALTRNATEALRAAIMGYNRLRRGDAVLYADLDYDSMQACCDGLARRHDAIAIKIALPDAGTRQALIDTYAAALDANPNIRLMLLTHLSHRTGLVLPVSEIVTMAQARGVDCIVDAAHSVGQLDFTLPDLKAGIIGLNLHKWVGAPLGCGLLYVRRDQLDRIDTDPADGLTPPDNVRARVHTGTVDYAAWLSIADALDFREAIGSGAIAARLRTLRDRWVLPLRALKGLEILTPDDPASHGAITAFRIAGRGSAADNEALAKRLLDQFNIFTVARHGVARGSCIRVTPALATQMHDVDRLTAALRIIL